MSTERDICVDPSPDVLALCLARIRARLLHILQQADAAEVAARDDAWEAQDTTQSPLGRIVTQMGLTAFERDLLVLCAGAELDPAIAAALAELRGPGEPPEATFSIALACLDAPHWDALSPGRPLRYWQMLTLDGRSPTRASLTLDERGLVALLGLDDLDRRLLARAELPQWHRTVLPPSHLEVISAIGIAWEHATQVITLDGPHKEDRQRLVARAAAEAGRRLWRMQAQAIPGEATEAHLLQRLWEREALLQPILLLVEAETDEEAARALAFVEGCACPMVLSSRERIAGVGHLHSFHVPTPSLAEQEVLWRQSLGDKANGSLRELPRVLGQFKLSAADIQRLGTSELRGKSLWNRCRTLAEPRLARLADRVKSQAEWGDLVLPERETEMLHHLVAQVRNRFTVYYDWGMAAGSTRGHGVTALFAGPSGTGKTLAAEVIANDLELDLYRVDLSAVVSKYIGETEKNLARIFDAAEAGGVVLLFDEADALFGERSQVRDSHDRYANIEIAYLLQRMEAFAGLSVLTTNIRDAIDQAFLRRLRFLVDFPFPDKHLRRAIWSQSFSVRVTGDGLDLDRLARLNVAGGTIRTIALNAAFLAADQGVGLDMGHIRRAASFEYDKMGRLLSPAELEGWS